MRKMNISYYDSRIMNNLFKKLSAKKKRFGNQIIGLSVGIVVGVFITAMASNIFMNIFKINQSVYVNSKEQADTRLVFAAIRRYMVEGASFTVSTDANGNDIVLIDGDISFETTNTDCDAGQYRAVYYPNKTVYPTRVIGLGRCYPMTFKVTFPNNSLKLRLGRAAITNTVTGKKYVTSFSTHL